MQLKQLLDFDDLEDTDLRVGIWTECTGECGYGQLIFIAKFEFTNAYNSTFVL